MNTMRWPLFFSLVALTAFRPAPAADALFWHTDLEVAKIEARNTGKPILSLRMLGKLTDELSCANSRYFRTALYANPEVAALMREKFVLHWSSERAVPVITIDFGDGRTIKSTITGNSAHYVLDDQGRVIDVIPGLYSPAAFMTQLRAAPSITPALHAMAAERLERAKNVVMLPRGRAPASAAVRIAVSKAIVESPMLGAPAEEGALAMDAPVILAKESIARMREENPSLDEATFSAMVQRFQQNIARDTARNENDLHARIHRYLASRDRPNFAETNAWVYSELFATPASDPWLGLHDDTVYTGLENGGVQ